MTRLLLGLLHAIRWLNGLVVYRSGGTGTAENVAYHHPTGKNFASVYVGGGDPSVYWPEDRSTVKPGWTFVIYDRPPMKKEECYLHFEGWFPDRASAEAALLAKMRKSVFVITVKPGNLPMDNPEYRRWPWAT